MKTITIGLVCLCVLLGGCASNPVFIVQNNCTGGDITIRSEDMRMECYGPGGDRRTRELVYKEYSGGYYIWKPSDGGFGDWGSKQCR